jgi:menaquinone-9 beta-reductase
MYSRPVMEWVLRIMSNMLRPDEIGPAEAAYKVMAAMVKGRRPEPVELSA